MSLNVNSIMDAVTSHALSTGLFEHVTQHEPKSAPGNGLSCAIWVNSITPASSGLGVTSARVELNVRVYLNMLSEPQDSIDPQVLDAVSKLMDAYAGDFELGGEARMIDLRGVGGVPMSASAGYINQDSTLYRAMVITLPIIVNDVWNEVA